MWFYGRFKALLSGPAQPPVKEEGALRIGVLGAARITPTALLVPAKYCADVVIAAVGARDKKRAEECASKYGIAKAYGSYDEVIADSEIDAIYIPLPNGLHHKWALKALEAGKHVLCEKPLTSNEAEAFEVKAEAEKRGLIVMEAFHTAYHPVASRLREIVQKELGTVKRMKARFNIPWGSLSSSDIRYNYSLAGGSLHTHTNTQDGCRVLYCYDTAPRGVQ
eukprot:Colp12_sorted_trinity150504_noHs@17822